MPNNLPRTIAIEDTRFIFSTNFAGDASNDRFNDERRKANLIIPDEKLAHDLLDMGFKVRMTKPRQDDDPENYKPEYFVPILLKYRTRDGREVRYLPKVYLVKDGGTPILLDEDTVGTIDKIRVKNVNVVLNPYEYDPIKKAVSLYVRTMYVEQDMDDDPFQNRYSATKSTYMPPESEDDPF